MCSALHIAYSLQQLMGVCNSSNVRHLDLSYNMLAGGLTDLSLFPAISYLNLSHNFVTSTVPYALWQHSSLLVLDVSFNFMNGMCCIYLMVDAVASYS